MIRQRLPQKETLDKSQPRDLFQTPRYAVELLLPYLPKNYINVWECSAGEGKIAQVLRENGYGVLETDIRLLPNILEQINFLKDGGFSTRIDNKYMIVTNPPYSLKQKFFKRCIELDVPFALLISADYSLWTIDAVRKFGCEKLIPTRRIDYITPTGKDGRTSSSYFHSYWLTRKFNLGSSEVFVELTKQMKGNI